MEIKRGRVWIETVLYTLIGLALMAMVLAFVMPKINAEKDKVLVEQTLNSINSLDEKVNAVLQDPGNSRIISLNMRRGTFTVNSTSDAIQFYISDLSKPYSESGIPIAIGRATLISQKLKNGASVFISIPYSENITFAKQESNKVFYPAKIPYKFSIENLGVIDPVSGRNVVSIIQVGG